MKERRLAAIMFTDIVGYTSVMGFDRAIICSYSHLALGHAKKTSI